MKIRVFQSDKGDCLLLTSKAGTHRILVDGGMAASYTEHVAPELEKLFKSGKALDAVYVSHIDDDHIGGVLKMMDDTVAWRVFEFQKKQKNPKAKKPTSPHPPVVKKIWHNAFHDLLGDNAGPIDDMLAASSSLLAASSKSIGRALFENTSDLSLSRAQALKLVNRVSSEQLDIAVNPEFKHKLMLVKNDLPKLKIGAMEFLLIAPFQQDVRKLRDEWNEWLRTSKKEVEEIRRKAKVDADRLESDVDRLLAPLLNGADQFVESQLELAKKLGVRGKVTTPNLASIMFLAREGKQTVLLTGDGHADDAIKGLRQHKLLDANDKLHVNVIKVPHHGSEHNMTQGFARDITADTYIFCGNGFASNPELDVIDVLVKERSKALPNRPFEFIFNSSEKATQSKYKTYMKKLTARVKGHVTSSKGQLKAQWIKGSFIDV